MINSMADIGEGYIVVRVSTARGAIPLAGAEVIIRESQSNDSDVLANMLTADSGLTGRVALKAPLGGLSMVPGSEKPFETYNIEVRAHGYFSQYYNDVAVFDGITSYQSAIMIPLLENGNQENFTHDPTIGYERINKAL